jgi:hypothetical protein
MDDLTLPGGRFDAIIALDTLYFAADLPATLSRMVALLAPGGRMGLFWSEVAPEGAALLGPGETRLGQALARMGLRYQPWDLTREECSLWRRFLALVEALRPAFEGEGNAELYETMVEEGRDKVSHIEAGRVSRFLYRCASTTQNATASR